MVAVTVVVSGGVLTIYFIVLVYMSGEEECEESRANMTMTFSVSQTCCKVPLVLYLIAHFS